MTTVAKPFIGLFWLLRLVCAVFPEEPGPLNFIPTEGNNVSISHAVSQDQGWIPSVLSGSQLSLSYAEQACD